ncbi:MAG TPA: polysaccharide deacetylase family protein [Solirubrobacteraceae bacterium]|jgi:peptidoglycan/xylan/chitin deacetylase (PgdA/CDA1 family)
MRRRVLGVALALLGTVALLGVEAAGAAAHRQPLRVRSSSLAQDGRQMIWRLEMAKPFSPGGLAKDGHTLCLLRERVGNGSAAGSLCIYGPKPGEKSPRLFYSRITSGGLGPGRRVAATIARSSARELTATFLPADIGTQYVPIRWQVISALKGAACVPKPGQTRCFDVLPAKPALFKLHVPQVIGCVPSGSSFVLNGSRSSHVVALTFDDGPWPDTPQFLDVLEREHVVATFFQIGEQVGTYGPAVDRRMLADGDIIGDHTWNHADVSGDGSFAAGEISSAAAAIRNLTGFNPCLFRAPGGAVSGALISEARSMGFLTIQWDVDPRDWSRPGTDSIYNTVVGTAQNGSIILQHDGGGDRSETLAALPREIDTFKREGYGFVTIPQLLGLKLIYR